VIVHAVGSSYVAPLFQELSSLAQGDDITLNYQLANAPDLVRGSRPSSVPLVASMAGGEAARSGRAYVPFGFGAVAVVYNLRGVRRLKLTPATLSDIFLGRITSWNARPIARTNPGVVLPDRTILLVHLKGRSLLTDLLSRYLAAGSRRWRRQVGTGDQIQWPGGTAVTSEADMQAVVTQTPGAIGYLPQAPVLQNDLATAALRNPSGRFVAPTLAAMTSVGQQPDSSGTLGVATINAPVRSAYPIAAELYTLTYRNLCGGQELTPQGRAVGRLLAYLTGPHGQSLVTRFSFAPLPPDLRRQAAAAVRRLGCVSTL
jgi:phosphate transport system substrate-binding protein